METIMDHIYRGESLQFTFKQEATEFIKRNNLTAKLIENSLIDDDHYQLKGYKSRLYWITG